MTNTANTKLEKRLAELTKARSERKDPLDYPRVWTRRQCDAADAETVKLEQEHTRLHAAADTLARLEIEPDIKWRDHQVTWRATLDAELLAIRAPIRDDATRDRARALGWSIELIDRGWAANRLSAPIIDLSHTRLGLLMAEAHYAVEGDGLRGPRGFRGSLPEVEYRIKALTAERAKAQATLDALLMSDDEREKHEAAIAAHRVQLATMDLRGNAAGNGLVAFDTDGNPLPIERMTDGQRAAFRWFESVASPARPQTEPERELTKID